MLQLCSVLQSLPPLAISISWSQRWLLDLPLENIITPLSNHHKLPIRYLLSVIVYLDKDHKQINSLQRSLPSTIPPRSTFQYTASSLHLPRLLHHWSHGSLHERARTTVSTATLAQLRRSWHHNGNWWCLVLDTRNTSPTLLHLSKFLLGNAFGDQRLPIKRSHHGGIKFMIQSVSDKSSIDGTSLRWIHLFAEFARPHPKISPFICGSP